MHRAENSINCEALARSIVAKRAGRQPKIGRKAQARTASELSAARIDGTLEAKAVSPSSLKDGITVQKIIAGLSMQGMP